MQVAEFALYGGWRRCHAVLRQLRRDDAGMRGPAAVEALRPGTIGDEFEQAASLAARDPKCDRHLRRIQSEQCASGRCCAERTSCAGGVEAAPVCHRGLERCGNTASDLKPGDDGGQEPLAAGTTLLRQRQR